MFIQTCITVNNHNRVKRETRLFHDRESEDDDGDDDPDDENGDKDEDESIVITRRRRSEPGESNCVLLSCGNQSINWAMRQSLAPLGLLFCVDSGKLKP
eukprot:scaffold4339_cov224-Ochromonas_danica.AAC.4